ncbi:MAG: hypothetical protein N3B21_05390 [Clostridia bacterium]|nr:hypothetical protein [Clostridia bacterium]
MMVKASGISGTNHLYIDSDNNGDTGYRGSVWTNCGAEYLVENGALYSYNANGTSWPWTKVTNITMLTSDSVIETVVSLSLIGRSTPGEMKLSYRRNSTDYAPVKYSAMAVANAKITGILPLPATPVSISAESTDRAIELRWAPVDGATGYSIEVDGVEIDNGTSTEYLHSDLEPNTQHSYRIKSKNQYGVSEWSNAITKTTLLAVPQNVEVKAGNASVTLTWDVVDGADGYEIYRNGEKIADVVNATYIDTEVEQGSTYTYAVKAYNNQSNVSSLSSQANAMVLLIVPTDIKVSYVSSTSLKLSWDTVANAVEYDIYRQGLKIGSSLTTCYIDTDLIQGTTYTYTVRVKDSTGNVIGESNEVIVPTDAVHGDVIAPSAPINLR